jgi:type IV secretory pathway VirB2 component (pilin)
VSKKQVGRALAVAALMVVAAHAFAQYGGNEGQVSNFLSQSSNWLVTILGPGVFIIGMIMVGLSLAVGNEQALQKGYYVVGGGSLIFLSQAIVALVKRLAGGF